MNFRRYVVLLPGLLALLVAWGALADASPAVRIGVLAYRGPDEIVANWGDLAAQLAVAIPQRRFELHPLDGPALRAAVKAGELEFVLTNSSQYVSLAAEFGIRRVATVMLPEAASPQRALGSTVVTRADHKEIRTLADLRGRRIAAVAADAFGGYLAAALEFQKAGIDLESGEARMVFVGFPMRRALAALGRGEAEAAIVRTCVLEQLAAKGQLRRDEFRVVAAQPESDFPCAKSTPLYPDWPLAAARGVDHQLAKEVTVALLSMPPSPAGISWDVPADYQAVHELYREQMAGPYADLRTTTFRGLLARYRPYLLLALLLLVGALIHVIRVEYLVTRRTAELRAAQAQASQLQREAEHMARLSVLGEMSGTLAHELNQPLATIATYAQGLERRCRAGAANPAAVAEATHEIVAQTEHVANVIRRIRAFASKRIAVREVRPIADTVREAISLFSALLPDLPAIALDDRLPPGTRVEADHVQLQQVLLNLMKNAVDAMSDLPPERRTLSITLAAEDNGIMVAVADHGPELTAETLAHLFEPFFTTKPDGLGLGLAICKSIVEAHGSRLRVEACQPPPGLVFRFTLPDAHRHE